MTEMMAIDPNDLLLVKIILASVGASVISAWFWHMRAARGNAQAARHEAELKLYRDDRASWREAVNALRMDLGGRVLTLEEAIKHFPSSTDFAELEGEVKKVATRYEHLLEIQNANRASLRRIEDFLLKGKRP